MKLKYKILLCCTWAPAVAGIVCIFVNSNITRSQQVASERDSMRACMTVAEGVRDLFASFGTQGALQQASLLEEFQKVKAAHGEIASTALYRSLPIVAEWRSLESTAKSQGYTFRIAKEEARNPRNLPTSEELPILDYFKNRANEDYFKINEYNHEIIYARPIILSADCLKCHGDPAKSPTGNGLDMTGGKMENWKSGEVRGAFILKKSTEPMERLIAESTNHVLYGLLMISIIAILVSLLIIQRIIIGVEVLDDIAKKHNS
jgi:methyl-accepting chemotaxis protein